ncbi:hypothetical protein TTHERM_00161200 (macronuclear) [Tetrahymena thermophila SB210]|uniref:CHCH domain protein n=1 Tax=Tetrahymena thermophila (strain SB210) TaxID=312017 RepID=Q22W12_TETTS|nr:hypothetical protein TTHERM_00161200 [Tetrahymena thermophila SB210]EAR89604.2 hypothetical protein TTHERM_00161200 [Tetrahymena thermophila SB210]|eukprot:XP_001009850.2 hypothetical protein TTHERM_00161200 [Tetrahymena thermophila SB210]
MESRSYMFSLAKKRSTLLENKLITFAREDDNAPRTKILKKECTEQFVAFKECMKRLNDETKCGNFKDALMECGVGAFKKANSEPGYQFE